MELDGRTTRSGPKRGAEARLARLGPQSLTDTELLSVTTGIDDERALAALTEQGLRGLLAEGTVDEHTAVSAPQAARLQAMAELFRRLPKRDDVRPRLASPPAIFEYARHHLSLLDREEFHVLCLNTRNVLLRHARVAVGSVDQCHVDPREALMPAVACRATGIVLLHNHPSGDPEPSVLDVALTRRLNEGAKLLCIRLLDHLVLGHHGYVSLLARGLLGDDDRAAVPTRLQAPRNPLTAG